MDGQCSAGSAPWCCQPCHQPVVWKNNVELPLEHSPQHPTGRPHQHRVLGSLLPSISEELQEQASSGVRHPLAAGASLPSVLGGVGRLGRVPAPTSPPWLTLRGSAAGAFLPSRGRLLLQPSRPPGSGSPVGSSARVSEPRGCSELEAGGSAGTCLPRAFQAGRGSVAAAGLRKGASVGQAGGSRGCPEVTAPGMVLSAGNQPAASPGTG